MQAAKYCNIENLKEYLLDSPQVKEKKNAIWRGIPTQEIYGQEACRFAAWRESPKCIKSGGKNSERNKVFPLAEDYES